MEYSPLIRAPSQVSQSYRTIITSYRGMCGCVRTWLLKYRECYQLITTYMQLIMSTEFVIRSPLVQIPFYPNILFALKNHFPSSFPITSIFTHKIFVSVFNVLYQIWHIRHPQHPTPL